MELETRLRTLSAPMGSISPHLIGIQVRPSLLPRHLNGVQVAGGSNPPAPTNFLNHPSKSPPLTFLLLLKSYLCQVCSISSNPNFFRPLALYPIVVYLLLADRRGVGGGYGGGGRGVRIATASSHHPTTNLAKNHRRPFISYIHSSFSSPPIPMMTGGRC